MIFEDDDDPERGRRRWNAYLAAIDAEIAQEARDLARVRPSLETDIGKVLDRPSPFVVDIGSETTRADRDAIQAEQDRWARLEKEGR